MTGSEDVLNLFLKSFSARDVAEALPSCDDTASVATVREAMDAHRLDLIGIRQSGMVAGWIGRDDLKDAAGLPAMRAFEKDVVIAETAPLSEVIDGLGRNLHLFVRSFQQVSGLIRRSDLEKPALRMWLFGLVTFSELRVTHLIAERFPTNEWEQLISAGRLQKATELLSERRRRNQEPSLLDCLQFADKGDIVARDEVLRGLTRFSSRRQVESFVKALQDLRNNLAHAQDLSGDWDVILDLATNLTRIVLGHDATRSSLDSSCEDEGRVTSQSAP